MAKKQDKPKDSLMGRQEFQEKEHYPEHKTDLPEDRFQNTKQTTPAQDVVSTASTVPGDKLPDSGGSIVPKIAKDIKSSMSLRPHADVELSDGKQVGGVPLASSSLVRSVAGISNVSSVVDASKSSYTEGGNRPGTRFGKKNTVGNFVIDNAISEQVVPHFDEVPNLNKAPDEDVGFNGNKQYAAARGKKNGGSAPQNLLFDRSVDFDHDSFVVHTTGQVLDTIIGTANYPTKTQNAAMAASDAQPDGNGYYDMLSTNIMRKANYLLKEFTFSIDANGHIANPSFVEKKINSHVSTVDAEKANINWQLDSNNVTNTIIHLQKDLGRETAEKFSPLGYVIEQNYEYNMVSHDIEATVGAIMGLSYKSAAVSQSYQLNMLGKDGAKPVSPAYRAFLDGIVLQGSNEYYDGLGGYSEALFGHSVNGKYTPGTQYLNGSAAAMIQAFDSTQKYTTKADIANQGRNLKFWLQAVDNNLNNLHAKKEFFQALDDVCMFSTIDGTYNPMLPIHVTDAIHIMNPLSLNYFLKGWTRPSIFDGTNTGTLSKYEYAYHDLRNTYSWSVKHPIVEGLLRWMLMHEGNLARAYGKNVTVHWPCSFNMTTFNMFAYVMCAASFDVSYMRNVWFRDILFAGEQSQYIWSDLTDMKSLNPLASKQYGYVDYGSPLKLGKLSTSALLREYWPETYLARYNSNGAGGLKTTDYLLPWYLSETSMATYSSTSEFTNMSRPNVYNYPSRRSGVNSEIFDKIYDLTPKDLLLSMDSIVRPIYPIAASSSDVATGAPEYAYDSASLSNLHMLGFRYDVQSEGRVLMKVDRGSMITMASVYEAPRLFGYIFPDIGLTSIGNKSSTVYEGFNLDEVLDSQSARYIESFSALGSIDSDGNASNIIDRTSALQQGYRRFFANRRPDVVTINQEYVYATSLIPCFSGIITAANDASDVSMDTDDVALKSVYPLNGGGTTTLTASTNVVSISKYVWTLIQRIFYVVNPFEGALDPNSEATNTYPSAIAPVDNMESATYFGFAGMKGADYNQFVIQRLNNMDQLNVSYVTDDFLSKSIIFRETN